MKVVGYKQHVLNFWQTFVPILGLSSVNSYTDHVLSAVVGIIRPLWSMCIDEIALMPGISSTVLL